MNRKMYPNIRLSILAREKLLVYILDFQTIYSLSVTLSTIKLRYKYGTIIP